mmetsp:Transcript_57472/g.186706  ORF Transcript_57472/g.186706 Transcript_57472/m.186706 type:complete len:250 (-) Transcript_57472:99-848(-)
MLRRSLVGATRRILPRASRTLTVVANQSWSWEFRVQEAELLAAEYDLPETLEQPRAIRDFFQPLVEYIRSGPTPLLDVSSVGSLRNAARTLKMLDDLQQRAEALVAEERAMEAVVLITSKWHVVGEADAQLLTLSAQRNWRDRAPAAGAVVAGLLGPLAWIPGALGINEVIMRRVDRYGGLSKSTPSGYDLMKATMNHHIVRAIYDRPRVVKLAEHYEVADIVELETLREAIADGSHSEHVKGRLGDEI